MGIECVGLRVGCLFRNGGVVWCRGLGRRVGGVNIISLGEFVVERLMGVWTQGRVGSEVAWQI